MTSKLNITPEQSEDLRFFGGFLIKSMMFASLLISQGVTLGDFLLVVGVLALLGLVREPL